MTTNKPRLVDPLPLSRRKYLANYLGRAQGKVGRLRLIDLAKEYPDKVHLSFLPFFFCCHYSELKNFPEKIPVNATFSVQAIKSFTS